MVTSPYELKILEWDEKTQTNKQTNKQTNSEIGPCQHNLSVPEVDENITKESL